MFILKEKSRTIHKLLSVFLVFIFGMQQAGLSWSLGISWEKEDLFSGEKAVIEEVEEAKQKKQEFIEKLNSLQAGQDENVIYTYELDGSVTVTDKDKSAVFKLDKDGNILSVIESSTGKKTEFTRDGKVEKIIEPDSSIKEGVLTVVEIVTDPDGTTTKTVYNPDNTIDYIVRQEPNSWAKIITYSYTSSGKTLIEYTSSTYTLDSAKDDIKSQDKLKETDYNSSNIIIAIRYPNGVSYTTTDGITWTKTEPAINLDLPNRAISGYIDTSKGVSGIEDMGDYDKIYLKTALPTGYNYSAGTPIAEHSDGCTYTYVAACGLKPELSQWTNYTGQITGETATSNNNKFREGTKYVKILILPNYTQNETYTLRFDDLSFKEATKNENLINNGDASEGDSNFPNISVCNTDGYSDSFCFEATNPANNKWFTVGSSEYIPVDTTKIYELSGWFESVGAGGKSNVYYGICCYDENKKFISVQSINLARPGSQTYTRLFNDAKSGDMYVDVLDASKWLKSGLGCVAFNTDPTTDRTRKLLKGAYDPAANTWTGGIEEEYYFGAETNPTYVKDAQGNWKKYAYNPDGSIATEEEGIYKPVIDEWIPPKIEVVTDPDGTTTKTVYHLDNTINYIIRQEPNSWATITTCEYTDNGGRTETLHASQFYTLDSTKNSVSETDKINETDYDLSGNITAVRYPNGVSYTTTDGITWTKTEPAVNLDLPNRAISSYIDMSAGGIVDMGEYDRIYLKSALTQSYSAGTTIAEHSDGGSYTYVAACGLKPELSQWTKYTGQVTGETASSNNNKFREGTKYVKILILPNYAQDNTYTLRFDDLCFKEATKNENLITNGDAAQGNINFTGASIYNGDGYGDSVCFQATNPVDNKWFTITSSDYIPVDTTRTYKLSGWFESAGAGKSNVYYGVSCYDENKKFIGVQTIYRAKPGNQTYTRLFNNAKAGDMYVDVCDASNWLKSSLGCVAFNTDPTTDRTRKLLNGQYDPATNTWQPGIEQAYYFGTETKSTYVKDAQGNWKKYTYNPDGSIATKQFGIYKPMTNDWMNWQDGFVFIDVHPSASKQPTSTGKVIMGLYTWNDKLYVGFGDAAANTGPIAITPYNPLTETFGDEWISDTEAVYNYRAIGSSLYAPAIDAKNKYTGYAVCNEEGEWSDIEVAKIIHAFDMATLNGSDLWLAGSKWMSEGNGDGAALWHKNDSESAWEVALTIPSSAVYKNVARFYFIGVYKGKLYVQNGNPTYPEPRVSKVYDGSSWSDGPNLFPYGGYGEFGWKPMVFANKMVYKSKTIWGAATLWDYFMEFNGTDAWWERLGSTGQIRDFTVDGDTLYVLCDDNTILYTKDLIIWTTLPTLAPANSRSIAVLNNILYTGTTDSKLYALNLNIALSQQGGISATTVETKQTYVKNASGEWTKNTYKPDGSKIEYLGTYNVFSNIFTADGRERHYNAEGDLTKSIEPDGTRYEYSYTKDEDGNILQKVENKYNPYNLLVRTLIINYVYDEESGQYVPEDTTTEEYYPRYFMTHTKIPRTPELSF